MAAALLRVAGVTAGLSKSNGSLPPGLRLTSLAQNRDQLRSPTLGSRVWATFILSRIHSDRPALSTARCSRTVHLATAADARTEECPLSAALVQRQHPFGRHGHEVELGSRASFRLEDEIAALLVERKPGYVHRAMGHGQLELASPDARTVGEDSYQILVVTTRIIVLRTDATQNTYIGESLFTADKLN